MTLQDAAKGRQTGVTKYCSTTGSTLVLEYTASIIGGYSVHTIQLKTWLFAALSLPYRPYLLRIYLQTTSVSHRVLYRNESMDCASVTNLDLLYLMCLRSTKNGFPNPVGTDDGRHREIPEATARWDFDSFISTDHSGWRNLNTEQVKVC